MEPDLTKPDDLTVFLHKDVLVKMVYAWCVCLKCNMPSVGRAQAIAQFYKYHGLTEDGFMKYESMRREVYRLETKIRNFQQNDHPVSEPVRGQSRETSGRT